MKKILFATKQSGKIKEAKSILTDFGIKVIGLDDICFKGKEPKETKESFCENAVIKAKFYGRKTSLACLADDSGLVVDALPGELGVKSKRFASGTDLDRNKKLLAKLKNVKKQDRTARFTACIAFYDFKNGKLKTVKGSCEGEIGFNLRGRSGFGYDPVFFYEPLNKAFSEMDLEEKNRVSHRGKALDAFIHTWKTHNCKEQEDISGPIVKVVDV